MGSYSGVANGIKSDANLTSGSIGSLGNLFYSTRNIFNPGGTQWAEEQTPGGSYFGTTLAPGTVRTASTPGILEGMHLRGSNSFFATPLGFLLVITAVVLVVWLVVERGKK